MNQPEGAAAPGEGSPLRHPWLRRVWPRATLALAPVALVLCRAGAGVTLWGSDMIAGSYHIRGLVGSLLREGRLPVWDPHTMCGFPLLAAMQAGVFYPFTWPAALLSPGPFWTFTVALHLVLAGQFAFGWLRSGLRLGVGGAFLGACVFMLSGYILTRVLGGHISQVCSYPWLAAVLWRLERVLARPNCRRWVLLAASVALLILPGFPQFALFAALVMGVRLAAYRIRAGRGATRTLLLAGAAGAVGVLLCAPQLLATMELIPEVQRVSSNSYEFGTSLSTPWYNVFGLLCPSFFGDDLGTPYWSRGAIWEVTGFVGIGTLVLGVLALNGSHPQRHFWLAAALLSLLLALGSQTPIFKIFYYGVPGAKLFRHPGRYLSMFTLAMTALAAMGFDRLWKDGPELRRSVTRIGIAIAVLLAALLAALGIWKDPAPGEQDAWDRFVGARLVDPENLTSKRAKQDPSFPAQTRHQARSALGWGCATLGALGIGLLAYSRNRVTGRRLATVLGAVAVIELLGFGYRFLIPYDARLIAWPPEFVDFVKQVPGYPFRIASPGSESIPQIGKCQLAGLDHVAGYESMMLRRYCELINVIHGRPRDRVRLASTINTPHPVLDMLGVKYWLVPETGNVPPGWRSIGKVSDGSADILVLESPRAFPRAFIVPASVTIPSPEERLRFLMDPSTDLTQVVVLESGPSREAGPRAGSPGTRIVSHAAGEYEIATDSPSGGILVLTESFYPGWEARLDGGPVEILRANHLVQAVPVPAGRHTVQFRYRVSHLGTGFLISLGIVLGTAGVWMWRLLAGKDRNPAPASA
jgi:hypothetical protein